MIIKQQQVDLHMHTADAIRQQQHHDGKPCFREFFKIQPRDTTHFEHHPRRRFGKTRYDTMPAKEHIALRNKEQRHHED